MSVTDPLLQTLYSATRDPQAASLAAQHAPILYFDVREPFLPLAAGYTIFTQDGPSPSFDREIELRPDDDRPPASTAIEYAIWWDWDIHHLYELEHVWIYLDGAGQAVRVEGSWHGKFYDIPLKIEDGHAVLLSEPGKHAFAPNADWFYERVREFRRSETQAVSLHAHVLVNNMFQNRIRQQAFDCVLARSYLKQQAFTPEWNFSRRFAFHEEMLVPWPALAGWIPRRVNHWLERLETTTRAADYCALRLAGSDGTLEGLRRAAESAADSVIVPVILAGHRLLLGRPGPDGSLDLDEALKFCASEPMGAFLEVSSPEIIDPLAWFVRSNDLSGYVVVTSTDVAILARYSAYVNGGQVALQLKSPDQDPITLARECGARFVNPLWAVKPDGRASFTPQWIRRVHAAGLGILSWPINSEEEFSDLQHMGVDVVWLEPR